jgi:hypothetical protein
LTLLLPWIKSSVTLISRCTISPTIVTTPYKVSSSVIGAFITL